MQPCVEAIGIAEDETGGGVAAIDRGACERREGVMIAPLRPFHEVSLHVAHRLGRDLVAALPSMATGSRRTVPGIEFRSTDLVDHDRAIYARWPTASM